MNPPQVYLCSPSWTLLPPPSPYSPSGSSQGTSPKHPVSCIEPGLATRFIRDIIHVSMPFSQISPPSPSTSNIQSSNWIWYNQLGKIISKLSWLELSEKVKMLATQWCSLPATPMNCSLPGSSVHGILQARKLEWVAIPFSRGSSWPREWTKASCIAGRFFTI